MSERRRKRRPARPARQPAREVTADQDDLWVYIDGRRMFVAGYTSGGAPYGVFEDEMDVGLYDLDAGDPFDFP